MPNTSKTKGPPPDIMRTGQTASDSYGQNPSFKGKAPANEKVRDLKP